MPIVQDYRALMSGNSWNGPGIFGAPVILTYSFPLEPPSYMGNDRPSYAGAFSPFSESEKIVVREAMAMWSSVAGLTFVEVADRDGDMNFSWLDIETVGLDHTTIGGMGEYPQSISYSADGKNWIWNEFRSGGDIYFGSYFRYGEWYIENRIIVALHEIGHAIGLKHPHDTHPGHDEILSPDPVGTTVMSYEYQSSTIGPLDIAAAQYLYGAPGASTRWLFDESKMTVTYTGTTGADGIRGSALDDIIYGNGGDDIISASFGNDKIYIGSGRAQVQGGDGIDIVYSSEVMGSIDNFGSIGRDDKALYKEEMQRFIEVEYVHFADAVVDISRMAWVKKVEFDNFAKIQHILSGSRLELGRIEAVATSGRTTANYVTELLNDSAKDSTIPAVMAYEAMLGTPPVRRQRRWHRFEVVI